MQGIKRILGNYINNLFQDRWEWGKSDMTIERYLDTNIPELYIVAKGFNEKGSIYYRLKNRLEIRSVLDVLELN